ncbi:hypothetical protein [Telmatospirillum sp.]|uniref:hypothetical protein n=1 Tax=Telmatospirillum sp. TaxID=2079197 RepID=UPI002851F266|nr:hypothetical protein [Telmatospirillum sp.]MDR3441349.1 hypothetical protein [Telmatospirillum sp.]
MLTLSRILLALAVIAVVSAQPSAGQNTSGTGGFDERQVQPSGLSVDQARQLLVVVLQHEKLMVNKPGFNIENIEFVPGYVNFFVTYDSPKAGATDVIGGFAVSPRTGDVWETTLCKRYQFRTLSDIQKRIMEKTGKRFATNDEAKEELGCD